MTDAIRAQMDVQFYDDGVYALGLIMGNSDENTRAVIAITAAPCYSEDSEHDIHMRIHLSNLGDTVTETRETAITMLETVLEALRDESVVEQVDAINTDVEFSALAQQLEEGD